MTEKLETRLVEIEEFRAENKTVSGLAIVFNRESQDLGGFTEIISEHSLDGMLPDQDVLALMNHEKGKVLARYKKGKGSLKLSLDNTGLRYSFEPPNTDLGATLVEALKRGDISNSSFAFTVADEEVILKEGQLPLRKINRFERIFDVSPVYFPAYEDTSVALRSIESIKETREKAIKEEAELRAKENEEAAAKLAEYFRTLDEKIKGL